MNCISTALASASLLLTPLKAVIAAPHDTTKNVDTIAQGLRQKGFQAEIDKIDPATPGILTGLSGSKIYISFSSCVGMDCKYAEIFSSWDGVDSKAANKIIMATSTDEAFTSVSYSLVKKRLSVYHYVLLGADGITLGNMIENLQYFSNEYEAIGKLLA